SMGNPEACSYEYGSPAVTVRQVSYDGSSVAEEQDFSYSTTWGTNGNWTSKKTTVTTNDNVRAASFQTTYTYSAVTVGLPPNEVSYFSLQVPVESQVSYQDRK